MPPPADDLIDAISDTVGALVNVGAISASADNDRFEAYIWSIVVRAAIAEGAAVTYRDPDNNQVYEFAVQDQSGVDLIESTTVHACLDSVSRKARSGSSYRHQNSRKVACAA